MNRRNHVILTRRVIAVSIVGCAIFYAIVLTHPVSTYIIRKVGL